MSCHWVRKGCWGGFDRLIIWMFLKYLSFFLDVVVKDVRERSVDIKLLIISRCSYYFCSKVTLWLYHYFSSIRPNPGGSGPNLGRYLSRPT